MKEQINHILTYLKVEEIFTSEELNLLKELKTEIENVLEEVKPLNQLKKESE